MILYHEVPIRVQILRLEVSKSTPEILIRCSVLGFSDVQSDRCNTEIWKSSYLYMVFGRLDKLYLNLTEYADALNFIRKHYPVKVSGTFSEEDWRVVKHSFWFNQQTLDWVNQFMNIDNGTSG